MREFFSPHHFVWIIPLGCFALFIIAATCYFLRREIASFFRKMFFPDTNRYIIPAGIISNVNTDKVQGPLTPEKIEALIESEEQKTAETREFCPPKPAKPAKKKGGFLRRFETNFRWHFRHIKHSLGKWFAEFAGTEDSPSNAAKVEQGTVKVMAERAENITQPLLPPQKEEQSAPQKEEGKEEQNENTTKEEAKDETPTVQTEPVKEAQPETRDIVLPKEEEISSQSSEEVAQKTEDKNISQLPKEELPKKAVEQIPVAAADFKEKDVSLEQEPRKNFGNDFMSDRTAIILALLILAGFAIFLGARVKLLGSIVMRQRVEMRNMQKQIEMLRYEQSGFKIIIHERAILPQKRYNR